MNMAWDYRKFNQPELLETFNAITTIDPAFDQLTQYYDENRVLSQLSKSLKTSHDVEMAHMKILSVRHVFGKHFQVVYQFENRGHGPKQVILSVHFFPRAHYNAYCREIRAAAQVSKDVFFLSDWFAVARFFPEDAGLPSVRTMIDPQAVLQNLQAILPAAHNIQKMDWKLLGYRPGERAAIRYCFPECPLVGKTSKGNLASEAHQRMIRLWEHPDRSFQMPRPLVLDPLAGIRWETFLPGERVEHFFPDIDFSDFIQWVCTALIKLHRIQMSDLPAGALDVVLKRMQKKMIPRICQLLGPLSNEIETYFTLLQREAKTLQKGRQCLIHGDLHTGNLLIDDNRVAFIDLDALALGDPAYDLAVLGSRLLLLAIQRQERIQDVAAAVAMLPSSYEAAGGEPVPQKTFAWYLSALLVGRQLKTCVRERPPDLGRLAPILVSSARRILETGQFEPSFIQKIESGCL